MESLSQDSSSCQDEQNDHDVLQSLTGFLVNNLEFQQDDLILGQTIETSFNNETVISKIAVVIRLQDKPVLMIRYAPGSIVTRERSALAAARIYDPEYQVPLVLVTNNQDGRLIDTYTGKVVAEGVEQLPNRSELLEQLEQFVFEPYADEKKIDREKRVLNVFDVNL